jgi:signal transduction histidine kinase
MTRYLRRVPLMWKILLPFLVLILTVGPLGAFLIGREVSSRSDAALNRALVERLLTARARVQDRGVYLFEAVSQAANLQGMAAAVARRDEQAADSLLRSVRALKPDVARLGVFDTDGTIVAGAGAAARTGSSHTVFVENGAVFVAMPICEGVDHCRQAGSAVGGMDLDMFVRSVGDSVAIYGPDGARLASSGKAPARVEPADHVTRLRDRDHASVLGPFELDGTNLGTLAVVVPVDDASVGTTTFASLTLLLLVAMGAVLAVGVLVARTVLAQVRVLHETSRALGRGELDVRAAVVAEDEIGDLARVLNQMADELQAGRDLLEARVQERTADVMRLLQERTEFFASLSHELRTPLAVILSQARIQLEPAFEGRRGSPIAAWKTVEASADLLLADVNAVLELARASSGRLQVHSASRAVADLIGPVVDACAQIALANDIAINVDGSLGGAMVLADPSLAREALRCLVDNALKYTPSRGRVRISVAKRVRTIEISITDTGIGVPADHAERIFEPFARVPGTETQHGEPSTGLGLAVARRLLDLQGGTVRLEHSSGEGSTFVVSLPRARTPRSADRPLGQCGPAAQRARGSASEPAATAIRPRTGST